jgi:large subunit ribosomal protein L30
MSKHEKKLRITYIKSSIGYPQRQKDTIRALGLKRLGDIVEVADSGPIRGMVQRVEHLIEVQQVS